MYSAHDTEALPPAGFPIRKSPDQSLFSGSPRLIAAYHVLHRLPLPRHPPYALSSLTIKISKLNQSTLRTSARTGFKPVPTSVCLTTNLLCNCQRTISVRRKISDVRLFYFLRPTSHFSPNSGGGERVRTDGLLRARQALSQLSYTPDNLTTNLADSSAKALAKADGGPGWTRTTDLTIISRVL